MIKRLSYFVHPKGDVKICKLCEGFGRLYVWRSDIEDYDEIKCPECNEEEN